MAILPHLRQGKAKAMSSPTQRSKKFLEKEGWIVAIVERWNPHARIRQDVFGFGDLLCAKEGFGIMLVQTTTRAHMNARVAKIKAEPRHLQWLSAKGTICVHGWSKKGARGKRKLWMLETIEIRPSEL